MAGRTTIICGFQTIFRLCLWREEERLFVHSKPISTQYFLREQHHFLHTICGKSIFWKLRLAGNTKVFLWIPNKFPHTVLAGRTMIICEFQTFCTLLWQEEQRLFVDSKSISAHSLWREEQRLFVDSKPSSAHSLWREEQRLFLDSKSFPAHCSWRVEKQNICGFKTIFRLCLWREEQWLFFKPFSACVYGGKNNDYL